jgi:nitrate/nitrite transporter NarK
MILLVLAAFGMVASTQTSHLILTTIAFSLAAIGFVVVQPLFWTLPTAYLNGRAAAAGIALIGSIGNLGGFVAPTLKTVAERAFGSQNAGMLFLSAIALVGVFLLAWVKQDLGNSRVLSRSI